MSKEIYLDAPNLGYLEKKYLNKAIDTSYVSSIGPYVSEFEEEFAKYLKTKLTVSTQSGTAAIHLALYELGIGRGAEVIVPALTFVATANPVIYLGAEPVFADVDSRTWNIAPEEIEKCITKKTKAIIATHLYGNPCQIEAIMAIARKYNLYVVEDATESLGAKYKNKYTGCFGDFGCFSFNGNKIITTGGGGMVVGKDKKKLEHLRFLVNQARDQNRDYYHPEVGFNYRMTNLEAALGLAQMKRLGVFLQKKRRFNAAYREGLIGLDFIHFQQEYKYARSSWWLSCIIFEGGVDVLALQRKLERNGICARRFFMPLTDFPPYKKYKRHAYRNAYSIYERGLCLPSSTLNSLGDINYVCKSIRRLV